MSYPVYTVYSGDVLPIFFDSFDGGTGASITMTGLAVTDIEIYKDGSATQRASDAGYTLLDTDGIDFDGITGIHGFSIDTGDNTDAGFYAVGSWFHVVVSSVTIDGQTVSFIAAAFRIVAAEAVAGVPVADIKAVSGDSTAADNLEAACDGGTYNVGGGAVVAASVTTKTGYQLAADQAVNATKIGGTSQTGRDLGASVLISQGTGAGQLDVTSGVIKANLAQILGTALTETAGQIAAAFKKVFDVATPVFTAQSVNQTGDSYAKVDSEIAAMDGKIDIIDSNLDAVKAKTDMQPAVWYSP